MIGSFLIKVMLLFLPLVGWNECFCQSEQDIIKEVKTLPSIRNKATVKGFVFDRTLYISKDSLNKGFTVELEDPSYTVVLFLLSYDCEDCDIWEKIIYGNKVTVKDAPILKKLKQRDMLSFGFFKIEKERKFYTFSETVIVVRD